MGFTQYFRQIGPTPNDNDWAAICSLVNKILKKHSKIVCEEYDKPTSAPIVNETEIFFNGKGDDGHETFVLKRDMKGFNCCKTARKPYDAAVVEVLKAAKLVCPNWLELSSDGDTAESTIF